MTDYEQDSTRRTVRVNTRLQPEVKARLDSISADLGMPASTLAAIAICEYVSKKNLEKQAFMGIASAAESAISGMIQGLELDGLKVASFVKALEASQEG